MAGTKNILAFVVGFPTFAEFPTTSDSSKQNEAEYTMVMKKDIQGCSPQRTVVFKNKQLIHIASGRCVVGKNTGIFDLSSFVQKILFWLF